eukprot:5919732-Pleurochrysis_carterae.AAC.3
MPFHPPPSPRGRAAQLSPGGAVQLCRDLRAVIESFARFSSRPATSLRRLHESCQLLELSAAERSRMLRLMATPAEHSVDGSTAQRKALTDLGIHVISAAEGRDFLSRMHND